MDAVDEKTVREYTESQKWGEPEGNGCIDRFFRALKEQFLWVQTLQDIGELQSALREIRDRYIGDCLLERLGLQSPEKARARLLALQKAS